MVQTEQTRDVKHAAVDPDVSSEHHSISIVIFISHGLIGDSS